MSKFLLIRGGAIGDFVMTLPILEAIHGQDSAPEIEILGYRDIAELAVGRRYAQASRPVGASEWAPLFARDGRLGESETEWLSGFDRVVCVWPDSDGVIRANLLRAGARDLLCVEPFPPKNGAEHAVLFMARQCGREGLALTYHEPHLFPSERDRWWAERYMRVTCAGEREILGLHPGSGSKKKNWPAVRYAEVARHWVEEGRGNVIVFAGPADDEALAEFQAACGHMALFIFQNETLPRVAAALERCEAFIGNDSGITHMAAAVRTPTVAIFGPSDPKVWKPLAPRVEVVGSPDSDLASVAAASVISALKACLRRG